MVYKPPYSVLNCTNNKKNVFCMCATGARTGQRLLWIPWNWSWDSCELPYWCGESNLCPLEDTQCSWPWPSPLSSPHCAGSCPMTWSASPSPGAFTAQLSASHGALLFLALDAHPPVTRLALPQHRSQTLKATSSEQLPLDALFKVKPPLNILMQLISF